MSMPTALLVDDSPSVRALLAAVLLRRGSFGAVAEVPTVAEARQALAARRFDLVVLDQNLPDGLGLDLLREIRTLRPQPAVIMLTGHADAALVRRAREAGVADLMVKPFIPDHLIRRAQAALARAA